MTETLSTSKEVPKTRLALEEKYKNEPAIAKKWTKKYGSKIKKTKKRKK